MRCQLLSYEKKIIEKIQGIENVNLLKETHRFLELANEDNEIYRLNDNQKKAVEEARLQIRAGQFLTSEQANKEVDDWLNI